MSNNVKSKICEIAAHENLYFGTNIIILSGVMLKIWGNCS